MAAIPPTLDVDILPSVLVGDQHGSADDVGTVTVPSIPTVAHSDPVVDVISNDNTADVAFVHSAPFLESAAVQNAIDELDDSLWEDDAAPAAPNPPKAQEPPMEHFNEEAEEMNFTMEDLFGDALRPDELENVSHHEVRDPKLFDALCNVEENFGLLSDDETAIFLENGSNAAAALKAIAAHETEIFTETNCIREVQGIGFGTESEVRQLAACPRRPESIKFLYSTIPDLPSLPKSEQFWLVDLPKVEPNRQILHVEAEPFTKETTTAKHSDDRRLYTPHNVIRWTYSRTTKEALSNTRLIMWSDGSTSLQVGKDAYDVLPSQEAAFNLLGAPVQLSGNWSCQGEPLPALIAAAHPEAHVTLKLQSAKNSVDHTLVHEGRLQRAPQVTERLAIPSRVLPEFADKRGLLSAEEEFATTAREQRKRQMRTNPMSFTDQFLSEVQLFERLHTASTQELEANQLAAEARLEVESTHSHRMHHRQLSSSAPRNGSLSQDEYQMNMFLHERSAAAPTVTAPVVVEPARKMRRVETDATTAHDRVHAALTEFARQIPEGNKDGKGTVNGLLSLLSTLSEEALLREVPRTLQELRSEFPELVSIPYQAVLDAVGFKGNL